MKFFILDIRFRFFSRQIGPVLKRFKVRKYYDQDYTWFAVSYLPMF